MGRLIVLDTGTLSLASKPRGKADADRCRLWLAQRVADGDRVLIPEIADYELRRELVRVARKNGIALPASVRRLESLKARYEYHPIDTATLHRAAEYWADVRNKGRPTAPEEALDGDAILAAQATLAAGAGDAIIIATGNAGHFRELGLQTDEWFNIG